MPSIDRNSSTPFYQQVYEQIAHGIEDGLYPAGKKLPSIRECARELGVSNTTIELAYQRLTEEGYVQARRGSGYTICELDAAPTRPLERFTDEYRRDQEALAEAERARSNRTKPTFDFAYDAADAEAFPLTTWARINREIFFESGSHDACLYNDRQGLFALREQIAHYLNGEYGLSCTPDQILIMPTTRDLVTEIASLFDPAETVIAMEDPGYDEVARQLHARGHELKKIPVYPYPSWEEARAVLSGARIAFATPACQFPTNRAMPAELRRKLVGWAQENDAYVIDDEYGWEFQSGTARMPPLAALDDTGRIITIGTFSNSFTPAVCLSYAVLPPRLMMEWQRRNRETHPQTPWQTQAAMSAFIRKGHWRAHVRKVRTSMARKRVLLRDAAAAHLGDAVETVEGPSSLFVLMRTRDGRSGDELVEAAATAGVRIYPTDRYWHDGAPADWRYVLVGYSSIPAADIAAGVEALARAWS